MDVLQIKLKVNKPTRGIELKNWKRNTRLFLTIIVYVTTLIACGGGGGAASEPNSSPLDEDTGDGNNTVPESNRRPVAKVGPNQTQVIGSSISLDGSASSDPNGDSLIYRWSFAGKPVSSSATLSDLNSPSPSFVADVAGDYAITLVVSDGVLDSRQVHTIISIPEPNAAPVANAGSNQTQVVGSSISLDGSASSDPGGDSLTYRWSFAGKPVSSSAALSDLSSPSPSFVADVAGDYILSLVVNDSDLDSVKDEIIVTAATGAGGILSVDTTWNLANSPYLITSDIQIAYGVTLLIDAGVKIIGSNGSIKVFGELDVNGAEDAKVELDNVNIAPGSGPYNEHSSINIDYAKVTLGSIYSPTGNSGYGSITLTNSIIIDIPYIYLWYPVEDCFIEKNIFINSGGISVGHSNNIKVYIRNNAFYQNTTGYSIKNWASYATSETIVEYNSFLNTDKTALVLPGGYTNAKITAINNYWNTTDTSVIDSMIYDKNDNLSSAGYISYLPFLTAPDPATPDITPYIVDP